VSSLIPWLFSYNSSLGNIAPLLWLSIGLQNGWVWPGLSFFLQQSFGELSPETTWSLANRAVVLNHWPWNCQMLVFTTVVFIGLGVPVVGWAVSVFMPALFYVGHRELFTGQTGNRKRAPRTVTESTMQTSAA
jgi:hypothetical protein